MTGRNILTSLMKSRGFLQLPLTAPRCPLRRSSGKPEWRTVHAGKVALTTASTDGIGIAVAQRLAQQGAHVILSSRKQENVDKAVEKLKTEKLSVTGVVCNVGIKEERENLVETALSKHGGIDYLFSNASHLHAVCDVMDTTEEDWTQTLHINVTAMFLLVKQVYPHMQKRGGGSIVLTSSASGYSHIPGVGPYCVSKTALNGLTKVLASDLYLKNIRLNTLAPGIIKTEMTSAVWNSETVTERLKLVYGFSSRCNLTPREMAGTNVVNLMVKSKRICRLPVLTTIRCFLKMSSETTQWGAVHAGKVAVMTASTHGIGFAVARRLAQQGAHVLLSSRNQENVDKAVEKLKAENLSVTGVVCDAGKKEDRENLVEAAMEMHGGIDYLFSNAAHAVAVGNVLNTAEEEWTETLHLNVTAMFLMVKQVVPHMSKRGGGSIVLTSSVAGYSPILDTGPYCVSKAAINCLSKVLAPDLQAKNIRLNAVAPGVIRTSFSTPLWEKESTLSSLKQIYGFSRIGEPEECAGIVSFLFSPDASYITGEVIVVGGGYRTRL